MEHSYLPTLGTYLDTVGEPLFFVSPSVGLASLMRADGLYHKQDEGYYPRSEGPYKGSWPPKRKHLETTEPKGDDSMKKDDNGGGGGSASGGAAN